MPATSSAEDSKDDHPLRAKPIVTSGAYVIISAAPRCPLVMPKRNVRTNVAATTDGGVFSLLARPMR